MLWKYVNSALHVGEEGHELPQKTAQANNENVTDKKD